MFNTNPQYKTRYFQRQRISIFMVLNWMFNNYANCFTQHNVLALIFLGILKSIWIVQLCRQGKMCFVNTYSCVVSFVFWPLDWPIGQNVILDQLISWFDQFIPLCLVCHQFSENIFYILHLTFDIWHLTLKWHDRILLNYIGTI